jgi:hypothetical protein
MALLIFLVGMFIVFFLVPLFLTREILKVVRVRDPWYRIILFCLVAWVTGSIIVDRLEHPPQQATQQAASP